MKPLETRRSRSGFTLIELMIVCAIIAVLSTMGLIGYRTTVCQAKEVVAAKQLREIFTAIEAHRQTHGVYPATLDELGLGPLLDPWRRPYQYLPFQSSSPLPIDDPADAAIPDVPESPRPQTTERRAPDVEDGDPEPLAPLSGDCITGLQRKDRFLVPINTYFDLYSLGADGRSRPPLTAAQSLDDVIVANDGDYIGLACRY